MGHIGIKSILEYIPVSEHAAIAGGTSNYDCYEAIMRAHDDVPLNRIGALYFDYGKYKVSNTLNFKRQLHIIGDSSGQSGTFSTSLQFPPDIPGVVFNRFNTPDVGIPGSSDGSIIDGLAILGGGGSNAQAHGIQMLARGVLHNSTVRGFSGNGIHIAAYAIEENGVPVGNANNWRIEGCSSSYNKGHGIRTLGNCANAGYAIGCDVSHNTGDGVYEESGIGNLYVGLHAAGNNRAYTSRSSSTFIGCYAENDQLPSDFNSVTIVLGGAHGSGFVDNDFSQIMPELGFLRTKKLGASVRDIKVDVCGNPENGDIIAWTVTGKPIWRLKVSDKANENLVINHGNSADLVRFYGPAGYGGEVAARPAPIPYSTVIPNLFIGKGGNRDRRLTTWDTIPTSGSWGRGDIVFCTEAVVGGPVGWTCIHGGTGGVDAVFKPFGIIYE